jgi:hypothetical protein
LVGSIAAVRAVIGGCRAKPNQAARSPNRAKRTRFQILPLLLELAYPASF